MRRFATALACGALVGVSACGDPAEPVVPVSPISIVITAASTASEGSNDRVTISLRNDGGPGDFYIEFWGYTGVVGCKVVNPGDPCPYTPQTRLGQSAAIIVTTGYSETVQYVVPFSPATAKVKSRPVNVAAYSQTSCRIIRNFGSAACP